MPQDGSEFRNIFLRLFASGELVSPRGLKVLEIENFEYTLSPYVRFANFEARKLNVDYIKKEFLWYLKGDRFDRSIEEHARMWAGLVNTDGSINSNYGQYIFGTDNQFDDALRVLVEDRDSRRASIMILNSVHLKSVTPDVPCTYSLNFRIRRGRLNMTVRMRSQDAIFGMCNDAPTFSFIHEMMLHSLRRHYLDLGYGEYHHSADSFHVYERHFKMLDQIVGGAKASYRSPREPSPYADVPCPRMLDHTEVEFLRRGDFASVPEQFFFTRWLLQEGE